MARYCKNHLWRSWEVYQYLLQAISRLVHDTVKGIDSLIIIICNIQYLYVLWAHRRLQSCTVPGQELAMPHLMCNCGKRTLLLHCTPYVRLCTHMLYAGDHVSSHPVLVIWVCTIQNNPSNARACRCISINGALWTVSSNFLSSITHFLYTGLYFTGDGILRDADGHLKITGRVDDVIKIKGRRIGTAELEQALVRPLCC